MINAERIASLALRFEVRKGDLLKLLKELVEMESPTERPEKVTLLACWIAARLTRAGVDARTIPCGERGQAVLATWGSETGGSLLLGHLDTVWPEGTLDESPYSVDEEVVRGPGCFDMKGGVAIAISVLEAIGSGEVKPGQGGALLLTPDEEVGSAASTELLIAEAKKRDQVLVLEPAGDGGAAKIARKGVGLVTAHFKGIAAHAGLEPEKGASALLEMARLALFSEALADKQVGSSVVPTLCTAGSRSNVVPENADLTIDYRFWSDEEGERVTAALTAYQPLDEQVSFWIEGGISRPAMESSPESLGIYHQAASIARQLGFDLPPARVGGASDGNLTAAAGIPTIDGLGPSGGGAHARSEHVLVADLPRRVALLAALLEDLGGETKAVAEPRKKKGRRATT
jgi:glutamate carboxypeptidase